MTAFSMGQRTVAAVTAKSAGAQERSVLRRSLQLGVEGEHFRARAPGAKPPAGAGDGALATIAAAIPAEGIAVYVAIYGLSLGLWPIPLEDGTTIPNWIVAFGAVVIAVIVTIFSLLWGGRAEYKKQGDAERALSRGRLTGQALVVTILCLITIVATTGNPFELFLGFPPGAGVVLAIVAAAFIAIVNAAKNSETASDATTVDIPEPLLAEPDVLAEALEAAAAATVTAPKKTKGGEVEQ